MANAGEQASGLFALPVGASLRVLDEYVLELIGEGWVLRVPKFTEAEIPLAAYARLPQRYRELSRYVDAIIPRFATFVAEGLVPPMKEPGPVNWMIVEQVHGERLDSAVCTGSVPRQRLEALLSGLAVYLHQSAAAHVEFVADIFHLDQFMHGTSQPGSREDIWLTDLEPQYLSMAPGQAFDPMGFFLIQVAELIKSLLYAERYLRVALSSARQAIEQLLVHVETIYPSAAGELRDSLRRPGSSGEYLHSAWLRNQSSPG